jgi:hypothetical protein
MVNLKTQIVFANIYRNITVMLLFAKKNYYVVKLHTLSILKYLSYLTFILTLSIYLIFS